METLDDAQSTTPEDMALEAAGRVPGWLNAVEIRELFKLAAQTPPQNPVCVEIGSWMGKSTVALGRGLISKDNPKLYCIDLFDSNPDPWYKEAFREQIAGGSSRLEAFLKNIAENALGAIVVPIQGCSAVAAQDFKLAIDFLFIDGDHAYPAVRQDFLTWSPLLKEGGTIAFHDFFIEGVNVHVGPRMVINEHIAHDPGWCQQRVVDTLFIATKAKAAELTAEKIDHSPAQEPAHQPIETASLLNHTE